MTRRPVLAGVALLLVATGCGAAPQASSRGPSRLRPVSTSAARGTHRATCRIRSDHGVVTLALDLPTGFVRRSRPACHWQRPVTVPDPGGAYTSDVDLAVVPVTPHSSIESVYRQQEPDAVSGDDEVGDDSILHLTRDRDVAALGGTHGERLSYLCFCDGQNLLYRFAEADGVLLSWQADLPLRQQTDRQLEAIVRSAGTER